MNKKPRSFLRTISVIFSFIIVLLIFSVLIFSYFFFPIQVNGIAMEPQYKDQDIWFIRKNTEIRSGNVYVYESPSGILSMGRVLGSPLEKILISNCKLYVNDKIFTPENETCFRNGDFITEGATYTVPDNYYFLVADNAERSKDSRHFGWIEKEKIKGSPEFKLNIKFSSEN